MVGGVPVLIRESSSVFSHAEFIARGSTTFAPSRGGLAERLVRWLPEISVNRVAARNYAEFGRLLRERAPRPRVLVVGGSFLGQGMESFAADPALELVETDVSFGPRVGAICDAHDLPFESESFDGVVLQAVLEHVADPVRCVSEVHRVLRRDGLVYAETPFMQQVHMGRYDFTRFTHLGHRRIFRAFDELDSGAACGPGMALAWSWQYFLRSFARTRAARAALVAFARVTGFWLKYLDRFLLDRPAALDAASGFYFLGRKSDKTLSDRDLIQLYRGAM